MASASASRQCSKCKDTAGSFHCAGCKEIFCLKHSIEHRQELSNRFEILMTDQNIIVQQMKDKGSGKDLLKQQLYNQIDQWNNRMMERVSQRTEELRRQVNELLDMKDERMKKDIQSLTDEIRTRREKDDFFEDDIKRIAQRIKEAEQFVSESMQQTDIKLYTHPVERVDWKDLIYIEDKSVFVGSSVTDKPKGKKHPNSTEEHTDSNKTDYHLQFDPYPVNQRVLISLKPIFISFSILFSIS